MLKHILLSSAFLVAALGAAHAGPINLVQNGSFETGTLAGYSASGGGVFPVAVIKTDGVTGSAFGEAIPSDPLITGSPDAGGQFAAYFVDDVAHQTLTQTVFLAAGNYQIGFDAYDPHNGASNANDATFTGSIAGFTLANYAVKSQAAGVWTEYTGLATIVNAGNYLVSFNFTPTGFPSADVVVDRVFVVSTDTGGGTVIPEPLTLSLFGAGLLGALGMRRKKIKA